jgi:hypothetical protein
MRAFLLLFFTLLYYGHMMPNGTSRNRTDNSMMMRQMTGNAANDGTLETTRLDGIDCGRSENKNHYASDDLPYHPFTSIDVLPTPPAFIHWLYHHFRARARQRSEPRPYVPGEALALRQWGAVARPSGEVFKSN